MRKALCTALTLSLLVLGACSAPAPTDNSEKAALETLAAPLPASDVMKNDDPAQTSGSFAFDSALFQGKLTGCSYAQAATLLVCADELYLYDTASGTVLAHCPAPAPMRDFGAAPFKDGIVLTVMGDAGAVAYIYDSELKLEETLELEELLSGDPVVDPGCVAASSDGNRLAIAGLSALYLYDRPAGQLTTLLDTAQGIGGSSCMATSLNGAAFTPDDDRVAFFGDGFSSESGNGEDSAPVWGTIGGRGGDAASRRPAVLSPGDFPCRREPSLGRCGKRRRASARLFRERRGRRRRLRVRTGQIRRHRRTGRRARRAGLCR